MPLKAIKHFVLNQRKKILKVLGHRIIHFQDEKTI